MRHYFQTSGFFCLLYLIIYFGCSVIFSIFLHDSLVLSIVMYLSLFLFAMLYLKMTRKNIKTTLHLRPFHPGSFFLVILLTFVIQPVASALNNLSQLFFSNKVTSSMTQMVNQHFFLSFFAIAVCPAIVEEILFRGIVYSGLRKARPIKGIILTALFFGAAHMNFNQFFYAFFLGIVLGVVLEATDSLFSSMTIHLVFNGSSVILSFLITKFRAFSSYHAPSKVTNTPRILLSTLASLPSICYCLALAVLLIGAIAYLNGRLDYMKTWFRSSIQKNTPNEKVTSLSYFAALAICLGFALFVEFVVPLLAL